MQDKVLIASFSDESIKRFKEHAGESVAVSAGADEAKNFVLLHKTYLHRLYRPQVDAVQLPLHSGIFNLKDSRLNNGAQRLNMHIHYWTVNKESDMRELLEMGVNGILTDRPDLLIRVMKEMGEY